MDGYPYGVGFYLANFLKRIKIINGWRSGDSDKANGMGCLAAQFISQEKCGIGNFYIHPLEQKEDIHEWNYHVTYDTDQKKLRITVVELVESNGRSKVMTIDEFQKYCCDEGGYDIKDAFEIEKISKITSVSRDR